MIEVEIKIPVIENKRLEDMILEYGFVKGTLVQETDTYFNSETNDLRKKDMALRIRQCRNLNTGAEKSVITYKGPKMDSISMTRKELETEIRDSDTIKEILESIGFYPLYPVRKERQYFHKDEITLCMDQVHDLGDFFELEIVVSGEDEIETALQRLYDLLKKFGFEKNDVIRTSYLSMLQKKKTRGN